MTEGAALIAAKIFAWMGRPHDAHLVAGQFVDIRNRRRRSQVPGAAAGVTDNLDISLLVKLVFERFQNVRGQDGVPVVQIPEQERHVQ